MISASHDGKNSLLTLYCLRSATECVNTWVFHYRKIFNIIPTLLRLHKSMKLRFFGILLLRLPALPASLGLPPTSASERYKNILWRHRRLRQMRNLNSSFLRSSCSPSFLASSLLKVVSSMHSFLPVVWVVLTLYIKEMAAKLNFYYVCTPNKKKGKASEKNTASSRR